MAYFRYIRAVFRMTLLLKKKRKKCFKLNKTGIRLKTGRVVHKRLYLYYFNNIVHLK